jgi:hypothetical protein
MFPLNPPFSLSNDAQDVRRFLLLLTIPLLSGAAYLKPLVSRIPATMRRWKMK